LLRTIIVATAATIWSGEISSLALRDSFSTRDRTHGPCVLWIGFILPTIKNLCDANSVQAVAVDLCDRNRMINGMRFYVYLL
jgi:hypothetical protein